MTNSNHNKFVSAIFLTFSGNCKEALTFYQTCFGGVLQFETFEKELQGYTASPIVIGSLVADRIIIHGSDLVPEEGRVLGNYMAIFIHCANTLVRKALIEKLKFNQPDFSSTNDNEEKLIEFVDFYEVRWVLHV